MAEDKANTEEIDFDTIIEAVELSENSADGPVSSERTWADFIKQSVRAAVSSYVDPDTAAQVASDVGMGLLETPQAVVGGAFTAVNEASDAVKTAGDWLNENVADLGQLSLYGEDGWLDWEPGVPEENNLQVPEALVPDAPTTVTGNLTRGVSQFLTGFMIGGRALKAAGAAGKLASTGKVGQAAEGAIKGAFSDAFFFDPHEERLANLIEEYPALSNPVSEFLAADPEDSEAFGRFKNTLEGLAIGAATEPLAHAVDALRKARQGDLEGSMRALDELELRKGEEFNKAQEIRLGEPANDPNPAVRGVFEAPDENFKIELDPQSGRPVVEIYGSYDKLNLPDEVVDKIVEVGSTLDRTPGKIEELNRQLEEAYRRRLDEARSGALKEFTELSNKLDQGDVVDLEEYRKIRVMLDGGLNRFTQARELEAWLKSLNEEALDNDALTEKVMEEIARSGWVDDPRSLVEGQVPETLFMDPDSLVEWAFYERAKRNVLKDAGITVGEAANDATPPRAEQPTSQLSDPATTTVGQTNRPFRISAEQREQLTEDFGKWLDGEKSLDEAVKGIDFNFEKIEGDADLGAFIDSASRAFRKEIRAAKGGRDVKSDEVLFREAQRNADMLGTDSNLYLQRLMARRNGVQDLDADVIATRTILTKLWEQGKELATMVRDNRPGEYETMDRLVEAYNRHITIFANAQANYKGMQTNVARALRAMKFTADAKNASLARDFTRDPVFRATQEHASRMAATDNPFAGSSVGRTPVTQKWMRAYNEYFVNSLLSSPKTQVVNAASNFVNTIGVQPIERMVAGATSGDRALFMEGVDQYIGMATALRDSLRLAGQALKTGDNILDPANSPIEIRHVIDPDTLELSDATPRAVAWGLGNFVRTPSRLMMSQDEFFKQMTYRGRVYAKARGEARRLGLKGKQAGDLVHTRLKTAIDDFGMGADADAVQYAREATFTQDLGYGISLRLQNMAYEFPALRLIMPFIRTPTNLLRFTWQHTPGLNNFQRQWREDYAAGGQRRAMAVAKSYVGIALWGTALGLAWNGQITGGGPTEPGMRKALLETGWQPYSIKYTRPDGSTAYIQYNRLDPIGMFLGLVADIAEVGAEIDNSTASELAVGGVLSVVQNLSSKTYAQGIIDAVNAIANPDMYGERFFHNLFGANVPNAMKHMNDDPYMREVRSFVDAFRSRVQGYSRLSDPRRNYFGEPVPTYSSFGPDWISPFAWSEFKNDKVLNELYRLAEANRTEFVHPPVEFPGTDVDLTKYRSPITGYTAYDRYVELINTVESPRGLNFKQTVEKMMESPRWERLSDGTAEYDGSKLQLIRSVQGMFRKAAQDELLKESPELAKAVETARQIREGVQRYGSEWFDEQVRPNVETEGQRALREILPKVEFLPE